MRILAGSPPNPPPLPASAGIAAAGRRSVAADDRFFRHVVRSMRSAVVVIRRNGALALMNDEAYRIFSLTPESGNVGLPFAEVFSERPELIRLLSGVFEPATTLPNRAELRLKDVGRVIGHTVSQVKDERGAVVGAVLFFKDLTQVEQIEERERLRDRLASLGEMAAGIAHELKNPLAAIAVMAGLLRRKVPDSIDAQSILADILSETGLANAIVGEMLEFVRPVRLEVERTNLAEVLNQALMLATSKGVPGQSTVHLALRPDLPEINGDHHQLCQVFTNLLTNALEAVAGAGRVDVTAETIMVDRESGSSAELIVRTQVVIVDVIDNGPGIRPDMIDRIFDPFFTTKPEGTGLGLSIVRKIVDAHDGRIDVSMMPGHGSRFRVTLPVADPTNALEQKGN